MSMCGFDSSRDIGDGIRKGRKTHHGRPHAGDGHAGGQLALADKVHA